MLIIKDTTRVIDAAQVVVKPASVTLDLTETQQFAASVFGSDIPGVVWACTGEGAIGVNSGIYTAPSSITGPSGTATVIASLADGSVSGTAQVVVNDPTYGDWTATVYSNVYQYYNQMGRRRNFVNTQNYVVEREVYENPTAVTAWIGGADDSDVCETSVVASEFVEFYFGDYPLTGYIAQFSLIDIGSCTHTAHTVSKSGADGWDSGAYSHEGWTDGCILSFKFSQTNKAMGVGLDNEPDKTGDATKIDYAFYTTDGGVPAIYENGVLVWTGTSYTPDTVFTIVYDGANVTYYQGDSLVQTTARPVGNPLYLDCALYSQDGAIDHVKFFPTTESASALDTALQFDGYKSYYMAFSGDRRAAHPGYPSRACVKPETIVFDIDTGYGIKTKTIEVTWTRAEILCKTDISQANDILVAAPNTHNYLEFLTRDLAEETGYDLAEVVKDEIYGHARGDRCSYLTVLDPSGSNMIYEGSATDMFLKEEKKDNRAIGYFTDQVTGGLGCTVMGGFQMPAGALGSKVGILFGFPSPPTLVNTNLYFVGAETVSCAPTEITYGVIYQVVNGAYTTLVHQETSNNLFSHADYLPLKIVREGNRFSMYTGAAYDETVFEDKWVDCNFLEFGTDTPYIGFDACGQLNSGFMTRTSGAALDDNPFVVYDHTANGSDIISYSTAPLTVTVLSGSSSWSSNTFTTSEYTPEIRYDVIRVCTSDDVGYTDKDYAIYYDLRIDGISPTSGYVGDTVTVSGGYFTDNMIIVLNGTTRVSGYVVGGDKKTLTFTMPDVMMGTTEVGYAGTVTIAILYYRYVSSDGIDSYMTKRLADTFTLYRGT